MVYLGISLEAAASEVQAGNHSPLTSSRVRIQGSLGGNDSRTAYSTDSSTLADDLPETAREAQKSAFGLF